MRPIEALSIRIQDLLKKCGMSKYRLAQDTCLNEKTIDDIIKCRSKDVKLSTLLLIIYALNETPSSFFDNYLFKNENLEI